MVVRPYAVLTLPAKDTVLGGLSEDACRVELTATPCHHDGLGSCYLLAFAAEPLDTGMAEEAQRRLLGLHAVFVRSLFDAGHARWTATAWIPVQNVAVPTFRLLEQPPYGMAPPWVVLRHGLAQIRLRPSRGAIDGFLFTLMHCLRQHGVETEVMVADLDDGPHERMMQGLETETPWLAA